MKDHEYNQLRMIFVYIQSDLNFFLSTYSFRYEKRNKKKKISREIKWWNPFIIETKKPKKNFI